jgi:hypothetical protein
MIGDRGDNGGVPGQGRTFPDGNPSFWTEPPGALFAPYEELGN